MRWILEPILLKLFHHNSISNLANYSIPDYHNATNFCSCHDSIAVMACAKYCSNHLMRICISFEFDLLWQKSLVKWAGGKKPYAIWRRLIRADGFWQLGQPYQYTRQADNGMDRGWPLDWITDLGVIIWYETLFRMGFLIYFIHDIYTPTPTPPVLTHESPVGVCD